MPETKSRAGEVARKPKGGRALFGAAMAQLAAALPPVITACGAILAAVSEPPDVSRRK